MRRSDCLTIYQYINKGNISEELLENGRVPEDLLKIVVDYLKSEQLAISPTYSDAQLTKSVKDHEMLKEKWEDLIKTLITASLSTTEDQVENPT